MELDINRLCCGCLSRDRKMKPIRDYWIDQSFKQILCEIPLPISDALSMSLCWECERHISKYLRFKEQVKVSSKILQDFVKGSLLPQSTSKLNTQKVIDISLNPKTDSTEIDLEQAMPVVIPGVMSLEDRIYPIAELISSYETCLQQDSKTTCNAEQSAEITVTLNQQSNSTAIEDQNSTNHFTDVNENYSDDDDISLKDLHRDMKKVTKGIKLEKRSKLKKNVKRRKRKKKKSKVLYELIELTPEEVSEERTTMSLQDGYVNAMFRCERCIVPFSNEDDYNDHLANKHELNSKNFKCTICECSFTGDVSLNYHNKRHTVRYQCVMCAERCFTKSGVLKHYEKTHCQSDNFDFETKLLKDFKQERPQETEINGIKSEKQFPCQFCQKSFKWKTSLRKHMETHKIEQGQKRKPYCEPCRLTFCTTSNLNKHVKSSSNHKIQLKLRKLKETVPDAANSEAHSKDLEAIRNKIYSQNKQFPCTQCDRKFQWKGNLLRHLNSHAARASGELVCKPCNRTFSSIATFNQHMNVSKKHVTEKDFKYMCSDCGRKFSNKTKLRDHIDWEHLNTYKHTCAGCEKVFKSHTSLYIHQQVVHNKGDGALLCDHCGKPFPNHTKLRNHISAVHTRDSLFECDKCTAKFGWQSCLSRHIRRVHKNKPKALPL